MLLERFYEESLAQASYMLGCQASREALIVDPNRDVEPYLEAARRKGVRIRWVTETHIHADYVSGARELADRTGATVLLSGEGGDDWSYGFADDEDVRTLRDGDRIQMGNVELRVLHTPGHTPEHVSFLVVDGAASDEPVGAFTGDFVFVGDVGRPDLLERAAGVRGSMEEGARSLFRSLQRFRALPDHLQLWPGHGAGSACGRSLGSMPQTTLGYEKVAGWAFGLDDEEAFVREVLAGQPEAPPYFALMKRVNREGPPVLGGLPRPERLDPATLPDLLEDGGLVLDVRSGTRFREGHVPGVLSLPLNGSFTEWAGWLLPYDRELYLLEVGDGRSAREAARRLALIGLERVGGYFGGEALERWVATDGELADAPAADPETVDRLRREGNATILDVRTDAEWNRGHIPGALHVHLATLPHRMEELPEDARIFVYCGTGERSAIGQSLLRAAGREDVVNVEGGFVRWRREGREVAGD